MTQHSFPLPRDANFTEEQHALADVAGDLFAKANPVTRLRDLWDSPEPRDRQVWRQFAEVGLTGIGVDERHGGMGGGAADVVMVLEHAGRNLLPEPIAATVAVAVPALTLAGGDAADEWLPRIVAGDAVATLSFEGDPFVLDVDDADLVLAEREGTLWLDGPVPDAVRVRSEDGSRRTFRRPPLTGQLLGGADLLADVRRRAVAAAAAELVGTCAAMLDQCVEYARVRQQFETHIGAFQAVQHKLADLFVAVESARGAVRHAARMLDRDPQAADHAVHVAKAAACGMHRRVNAEALQVFGGIGFTWEHDLHLWLKRGIALEVQHGGEAEHRRAVADALLGPLD